jgi:hypothetical protein
LLSAAGLVAIAFQAGALMMLAIGSRTSGVSNARTPCRSTLLANAPLLYLDFDNCLHCCDACKTADGIVPSDPAVRFFEFAGLLETALAPYRDVVIVLSTSWVEVLGFKETRARLPIASLRERVIDATYQPDSELAMRWSAMSRGQQVLEHVRRNGIKRWLAVDDMRAGFDGYETHLVHCQQGVGLGDKDVQRVLAERLLAMCARGALPSNADSHSDGELT